MSSKKSFQVKRFYGVAISGGKTDKTAMAVIEYYPEQGKIFLSELYAKIKSTDNKSADQKLHELIIKKSDDIESLSFDVPLKMPKCIRCCLSCPGFEVCDEDEIKWLRDKYLERNKSKRPKRFFTPYTERPAEYHISTELEERFHPSHALGANLAPLVARAHYIKRRLKLSAMEVYPRLSLWRIGRSLGIQKSYLRLHKHSVEGVAIRKSILEKLSDKNVAFLYSHDIKLMVGESNAFEAFLCAFTAVLKYVKQCEKRPKGFPKNEAWVAFPIVDIDWSFLDFKKIMQ